METKQEQIAFHKGALSTLIGEQQALSQMMNIVTRVAQAHKGA